MCGKSATDVLLSRQDIEIAVRAQVLHLKQFEQGQSNEKALKSPSKVGLFKLVAGGRFELPTFGL